MYDSREQRTCRACGARGTAQGGKTMSGLRFEGEAFEYGPGESPMLEQESAEQKNYYYVDAWGLGAGTPKLLQKIAPWETTAREAAKIYDALCGKWRNYSEGTLLTRCFMWLPVSGKWVTCRSVVGFPGTVFCGRFEQR